MKKVNQTRYSLSVTIKYLLFIFIFSLTAYAKDFQALDSLINKAIESRTLPGGVLLINVQGKKIYQKEYNSKLNMTYDLASLTKVITSLSIMILEEEGKLKVSDKLSKYYPEFRENSKKAITLEDLLRHTSGLPASVVASSGESYEAFINKVLSLPLINKPKEKTVYSDVGFIILGDLIQKVSKKSLGDFSQIKIFQPLAMKSTGYQALPPCAPTSHDKICIPHDPKAFHLFPHQLGHAGVFSTLSDFSKIGELFLNKGIYKGKRILKEESVHKMSVISGSELRGMGFDLLSLYANAPRGDVFEKGVSYGHTGFTGTTLWIDPKSSSFYLFLSNRVLLGEEKTGKPYTELRRQMSTMIGNYIYTIFSGRTHSSNSLSVR